MCTVCGCAGDGATVEGGKGAGHAHRHGHSHAHPHRHDGEHAHVHDGGDGHDHPHTHVHDHAHGDGHGHGHRHGHGHGNGHGHPHDHDHHHDHAHDGDAAALDFGVGPARAHVPGLSQSRLIAIETDILAKNDALARANRRRLAESATLALNLVSSPGSGKTTLLVRTVAALKDRFPVAVIEGDQQTSNDAERIRATGAPAVQVNTGKGCHLDAEMVGRALDRLDAAPMGAVFIENVGNLVCPAAFDLGEDAKVAIFSVTEGEDKPLKYPDMFAAATLVILSKTDLAPHCDADLALAEANCRRVNPAVEVIRLSARTGEGMEAWFDWIAARRGAVLARARAEAAARLAALEAAQ